MSASEFGQIFKIMSFGESHGRALGVVIDGCPAGVSFDLDLLVADLARRRPGANDLVTSRSEDDKVEILSGVFEGKTLGTPIAMLAYNMDARSQDYSHVVDNPRRGHADDVWKNKFGHVDHRGGGRASGRETISRVMAGSVAKMALRELTPQLIIQARPLQVGPLRLNQTETKNYLEDPALVNLLRDAKAQGESYGGLVEISMTGVPAGLGEPVFHKLKADLAQALMSVGAVVQVSLGNPQAAQSMKGTEFHAQNFYGGIRGGISTGEEIQLQVVLKPTSSILKVAKEGRHDPCIIPRALPVLEAMCALVLADHALWMRLNKI